MKYTIMSAKNGYVLLIGEEKEPEVYVFKTTEDLIGFLEAVLLK